MVSRLSLHKTIKPFRIVYIMYEYLQMKFNAYKRTRMFVLTTDTASQFDDVVREVAALIKGHIMVGHAIHHDFKALLLNHPRKHTRDTAV